MTFYDVLEQVLALLRRYHRVSYRALKLQFPLLDTTCFEALRDEILFQGVARDGAGQGLVWIGVDMGTPREALSPVALDEVSAASAARPHQAQEAERRQLTVLFCNLADSTKLSQQLDPEDLREVVRAYQQTSAVVIARFAGHIAQYLGDGLLVYFGYPQAHEDDALRTVHTGLGIIEAITCTLNPRLELEYGVHLAVRLGIHTGPVAVGAMGGGDRQEHPALGETPNIAARLEALAAPNTVVLSPVTARLVQTAFALEDLGPHLLKGVAEPMVVFRVLGPHETDTAAPLDGVPFLVGRDEELGLRRRRWEQSKEGLGQVVLLTGEAGIGKSSLVQVLRAQVRQEGRPQLAFRCSPYHQNSALYPVITHLERLLGFERTDGVETKLAKLTQALQPCSLPLDEVVPLLAALLSVPLPEGQSAARTLSPQQQKQQTQDALVAWLLEDAARQPVLVLWEDLHWADPSTLEFLGLLIEQTPTAALLQVLTFRPEFVPPWPTRLHLTPLTLNRLERPQVEALVTWLAKGKPLPAEVMAYIVTKTDGVPLYVEELTKTLLESALLQEDTDRYTLTGPLTSVAIPATLQDTLMARLDRLPAVREVAQLGAVLGREFSYEMLQALAGVDEPTLRERLAQLVDAELLYQRGRPPRATYIFKHALVQEAAYQSMLRRTRQHAHQQVAELVETRFADLVETAPELVAHHYTEAGCLAQAIPYWKRAGQQALERSANLEAVRHLSTALELLATLPETPARAQQELDLQIALGPALMATKGAASPEVEQTYARAQALCAQVGDTPQLFPTLRGLCRFYRGRGVFSTVRELGEQLVQLAERKADPTQLLEAYDALGTILFLLGDYAAARTYLK
jgi:class 3 adenylate cyclase